MRSLEFKVYKEEFAEPVRIFLLLREWVVKKRIK
jgi:hypothetical protein